MCVFLVPSIVLHNIVYIQLWCDVSIIIRSSTRSMCHGVIFRSIFRVMRLIEAHRLISKYLFLSWHDEVLCHHRCCFHLFIHSIIIFGFCLIVLESHFAKRYSLYECVIHTVYIARINGMMIYQRDCQFSRNTY